MSSLQWIAKRYDTVVLSCIYSHRFLQKQTVHVLDRFDTFNRYVPLRFEAELDKVVLKTYIISIVSPKASDQQRHSM